MVAPFCRHAARLAGLEEGHADIQAAVRAGQAAYDATMRIAIWNECRRLGMSDDRAISMVANIAAETASLAQQGEGERSNG